VIMAGCREAAKPLQVLQVTCEKELPLPGAPLQLQFKQ